MGFFKSLTKYASPTRMLTGNKNTSLTFRNMFDAAGVLDPGAPGAKPAPMQPMQRAPLSPGAQAIRDSMAARRAGGGAGAAGGAMPTIPTAPAGAVVPAAPIATRPAMGGQPAPGTGFAPTMRPTVQNAMQGAIQGAFRDGGMVKGSKTKAQKKSGSKVFNRRPNGKPY